MDANLESWPQDDCFTHETGREDANEADDSPYGSLSREKNEIRLIEVLPGNPSDSIRCRISSFALNEAPVYTALSYTWGRPDPDCSIELNGHLMPARKNLWRFLHQIRKLSVWHSVKFWIDAVCINQSDNKERSHQVALMAQIYSGAAQVLVWLGPEYGHAGVGFKALRNAAKRHSRMHKFWWRSEGAGLQRLCERRYWTRLWVVQELVLARIVIFLCGVESVTWQALLSVMDIQKSQMPTSRENIPPELEWTMKSRAASMFAQIKQAKSSDSLYNQMLASAQLGCSEPRDKIFALLGVVGRGHEQVMPDYDLGLSHLLNTVLRNQHRIQVPDSLLEIKQQCRRLADAVGVNPSLVFSLTGFDCLLTSDSQSFPLLHENSGLSFWWAVANEHEVVQRLWLKGIDRCDPVHRRALAVALSNAARLGDEGVCRLLLESKMFDVDDDNPAWFGQHHGHPLIEAARGGYVNIAKLILRLYEGRLSKALFEATFSSCFDGGHAETALLLLVVLLLETPGTIKAFLPFVQVAVSHFDTERIQRAFEAAAEGHFAWVDIDFIAHIAVRNAMDKGNAIIHALLAGIRLLRCASRFSNDSTEELLPEDDYGSLLRCSIENRLASQACRLIEHSDADVNTPYTCRICSTRKHPKYHGTPLKNAIRSYNVPIIEALLSRADLETDISVIQTAVRYHNPSPPADWENAGNYGEPIMATLLGSLMLDLNANIVCFVNLIVDAIKSCSPGLVKLLLQRNDMSIDWQGDFDDSVLHLAVRLRSKEIVKILLEEPDLDVNRRSGDGVTALMQAASQGSRDIIEVLLGRQDLDIALLDDRGSSALTHAVNATCLDTLKLLLLHGAATSPWTDGIGNRLMEHVIDRPMFQLFRNGSFVCDAFGDYQVSEWNRRIAHALIELADFKFEFEVRMRVKKAFPNLYWKSIWPRLGAQERALDASKRFKADDRSRPVGFPNRDEVADRMEYSSF